MIHIFSFCELLGSALFLYVLYDSCAIAMPDSLAGTVRKTRGGNFSGSANNVHGACDVIARYEVAARQAGKVAAAPFATSTPNGSCTHINRTITMKRVPEDIFLAGDFTFAKNRRRCRKSCPYLNSRSKKRQALQKIELAVDNINHVLSGQYAPLLPARKSAPGLTPSSPGHFPAKSN